MVRLKNRYFLCEILFAHEGSFSSSQPITLRNLNGKDVHLAVKGAVEEIHGDYGVGAVIGGLNVKYVNPLTNVVLIRVRRHANKIVWTSLPFIKKIAACECFVKTIHIGGTIRSCQKALLKYNRQQLAVLLKRCKTKDERQSVQKSINKSTLVVTEGGAAFKADDDEDKDVFDDQDSDSGD